MKNFRYFEGNGRPPAPNDGSVLVRKSKAMADSIAAVLERVRPSILVEFGVLHGGSTIFWCERLRPKKIIAFDILSDVPALMPYVASGQIVAHLGIPQDFAAEIRRLLRTDLAGSLIDAVIDDASHQREPTRITLETVLPFVRPGGAYIIEDWAWGHTKAWPADVWAEHPSMAPLIFELSLACGYAGGLIDKIEIDPDFVVLWRGSAPLPIDGSFRLSDHLIARGAL